MLRMLTMKTLLLVSLPIFLTQLTAVHTEELYVRVGDMVTLNCPRIRMGNTETPPIWTSFTPHMRDLTSDMNSRSPFLIYERSLILLNASTDHQGNYSCSFGNHTFWSKLVVYSVMSDDDLKRVQHTKTCHTNRSCTLYCPISNMPRSVIPNMTRLGVTWEKDDRSEFRDALSFTSVEETDQGTFSCIRSYFYGGQTYNMTFFITLVVKPQEPLPEVEIVSPHDGEVFEVELGSAFVVNCTATISRLDEIYWMINESFVKTDSNLRVFSNNTKVRGTKKSHMTTLLIFREVLKEDLSKDFTCVLDSTVKSNTVTISLQVKNQKSYLVLLIVIIVAIILVTAATALICVKFRMDIFLFLRDRLCFRTKSGDVKLPEATLLCYKSESDMALSKVDVKWLENALAKELGYKVCVHHNNFPGEENSVLDRTEQSHAVILVPVVSNPGPDGSLITQDSSSVHISSTRVILIQTEAETCSKSSVKCHEAVPLLEHVQQMIVTWKGTSSSKKSSFIKHLRYHLPPRNRTETMVL